MESRVPEQSSSANTNGKRKREKYALRACQYCQRRKIKCDSGDRCRPCVDRNQECHRLKADEEEEESRSNQGSHSHGAASESSPIVAILLRRLVQIEEKLYLAQPSHPASAIEETIPRQLQQLQSPQDTCSPTESHSKRARHGEGSIWDDGSAFAGETSARFNLEQMEDRLDKLGVDRPAPPSSPPTQPLTPSLRPATPEQDVLLFGTGSKRDTDMRQLLKSHSVPINPKEWETCLSSFFAEVHPLYPFLHPPSVREGFNQVRTLNLANRSTAIFSESESAVNIELAQVFLCLAIGRCTTATRGSSNGRHSAGWSLYCVATDLIGDVLNLCGISSSPLLQLQTLCLMIVYLFRLDANERAQNVLALAISHAQNLGINRNTTLRKMPHFQDEMFRRIWWCIYVLDRRLCLDTGRPFLVLDMNTDADMPSNLSDAWLSAHQFTKETTSELRAGIVAESRNSSFSSVSYLKAMIDYSRISAKVWEAVYAAHIAQQPLSKLLREYIEVSLSHWQETLPQSLVYDKAFQPDSQYPEITQTIIQQRFLLYVRYHYMRLMVRKPVIQPVTGDLENDITCLHLAHAIIEAFLQAPASWGILKFPCLPYLLGAIMASLSILITDPALQPGCARATLMAAELLKRSCYNSWVSGRTTRTIARLHAIVRSTLPSYHAPDPAETDFMTQGHFPHRQAELFQNVSNAQWLQNTSTAPTERLVNRISQPSTQDSGSPGRKGITLSKESRENSRFPTMMNTQPDGLSVSKVQGEQNGTPVLDFGWPELNMDEFDFEHSLSSGRYMDTTTDLDGVLPWDAGTGGWLDPLFTPDLPFQQLLKNGSNNHTTPKGSRG